VPQSISTLAQQIDIALDCQDEAALREALVNINQFDRSSLDAPALAALDFFAANVNAGLRTTTGAQKGWKWDQPLLEQEILHLRQALNHLVGITTRDLRTDLKLRITTNLGNVLNHVGRFVEAIELWDRALDEHPGFAMAQGNRGQTLFWYGHHVTDMEHKAHLFRESYSSYRLALELGVESHAHDEMQYWVDHLGRMADWDDLELSIPDFRAKSSKRERRYRKWCVENRLVLNPLNDVTRSSNGLSDTLTLPSIFVAGDEATASLPVVYSIFNQLKQEYTAARFIVFEALEDREKRGVHFADRGVVLYDSLDYRYYRLWIEKLKMAFLSAHAIFDKMAYLINEYWKLSLNIRSTSFSAVWYSDGEVKKGLSPKFLESNNWPLRGLYWLSRDFHYKPKSLQAVLPEAKIIHEIRNHIAHKYLRVHDDLLAGLLDEHTRGDSKAGYSVTDRELVAHTLTLLKLVRSALIYLSSAVAHEEAERKKSIDENMVFTMPISVVSEQHRL
jgi:tetratricopeptide (TPR) repeat protein